jgi:hypothetical protein
VRHRANPVCAGCHKVMDPLGLPLENFNATGAWRSTDAGAPVDVSGAMPDGTPFDGVAGLRSALLSKSDVFVVTLTDKLLTYALGRGVEYYDGPALRTIARDAARNQNRFSSLILGIVRSVPFQMRQVESSTPQPPVTAAAAR